MEIVETTTAGNVNINYKELQLTKYVGMGDSGVVYEGMWRNQQVVIKFLGRGDAAVPRQRPPASLLSLEAHPNIVRIIGYSFKEDNEQYLVASVKFKGAKNLNHFISHHVKCKGFFDPPWKAMEVMHQIAEGLLFLHSNNVLHTSLKPSNILIDENCAVRLVDFGIGNIYWDPDPDAAGACTKNYMAPEVLENSSYRYTMESDVYSFSVVCSELLTGMQMQAHPHVFDILSRLCCYPGVLSPLMCKSYGVEPGERPGMAELSHALRDMKASRHVEQDLERKLMNYHSTTMLRNMLSIHHDRSMEISSIITLTIGAALKNSHRSTPQLLRGQLNETLWMLLLSFIQQSGNSQTEKEKKKLFEALQYFRDAFHPNVINLRSTDDSVQSMVKLVELFQSNQTLFTHEKTWIMLQLASGMEFLHQERMYGYLSRDTVQVDYPSMFLKMIIQDQGNLPVHGAAARDVLAYSSICYELFTETQPVVDGQGRLSDSSIAQLNKCLRCQCSGHTELAQLICRCSSSAQVSFQIIHKSISDIRACLALDCSMQELRHLEEKLNSLNSSRFHSGLGFPLSWITQRVACLGSARA